MDQARGVLQDAQHQYSVRIYPLHLYRRRMMTFWESLSALGDSRALFPLATVLALFLPTSHRRLLWRWAVAITVVAATTLASKIAFIANFSCPGDGVISTMIEQFPNVQSHLSLLDEKDALGMGKVNVNWALSEHDRHTIKCIGSELAKQFADTGLGFVKLNDFVYDTSLALKLQPHAHHMGTTRMAASPEFGVVDSDCKVFGTHNLYVAGSSIFATSGASNPTMPLLQFAVRLAEHLDDKLKTSNKAV